MAAALIHLRGLDDVAVEYVDHGYEPDTDCHVIEFGVVDERFAGAELTDQEETHIYRQLAELVVDSYEDE